MHIMWIFQPAIVLESIFFSSVQKYLNTNTLMTLKQLFWEQLIRNSSVCELEPTHRVVFTNLDYKKLLTNTIQSFSIELRTDTEQLVPLSGTGKVTLTLQFKKFSQ